MGPLIAMLGDRVYISSQRLLAAGFGVGAGIGLFYIRNQQVLVDRGVT